MKLTIGKKITIGLVTVAVLASTAVGTVFAIKNSKEKSTSPNPGPITTPVQPDNPDIPDQPDKPDQPDQPDQPDTPPIEKTEQDYMNECQEKLTSKVTEALQATYTYGETTDIKIVKVNSLTGTVYATGVYHFGKPTTCFYELETNLSGLDKLTYEEASKQFTNLEFNSVKKSSNINDAVSEELYNQLCDYVLDKVGLEGAQILNATKFEVNNNSMYETTLSVFKNNKIYKVSASVISDGSQEDHINKLMIEGRTKEIKITSEENFKEFITESTAEASAQGNVVYFDITFPSFNNETNKETTKTLTVRQTNGKADYRGLSL